MGWDTLAQRHAEIISLLLHGEKYGFEIAKEYSKASGKELPLGSLYTTMDRLEAKGLVKSRLGEPNPERGGNRRRFYSITAEGRRAFTNFTEQSAALTTALGGLANA